jgi:plasmid stabilization system protein ParE
MGNELILTPEAEEDIIEAFAWYRSRHPELGERFLRAVESNFDQIADSPRRFLKAYGDVRKSLLHNFPYCVFFEEMPQASLFTRSSTPPGIPINGRKDWLESSESPKNQ